MSTWVCVFVFFFWKSRFFLRICLNVVVNVTLYRYSLNETTLAFIMQHYALSLAKFCGAGRRRRRRRREIMGSCWRLYARLFNNSYSQNYQMQLPTKPHFGFRFLQFQLENHIQYPDSAKIYPTVEGKSCLLAKGSRVKKVFLVYPPFTCYLKHFFRQFFVTACFIFSLESDKEWSESVFGNRATDKWNNLPQCCINCTTFNNFKSHIHKVLEPETK